MKVLCVIIAVVQAISALPSALDLAPPKSLARRNGNVIEDQYFKSMMKSGLEMLGEKQLKPEGLRFNILQWSYIIYASSISSQGTRSLKAFIYKEKRANQAQTQELPQWQELEAFGKIPLSSSSGDATSNTPSQMQQAANQLPLSLAHKRLKGKKWRPFKPKSHPYYTATLMYIRRPVRQGPNQQLFGPDAELFERIPDSQFCWIFDSYHPDHSTPSDFYRYVCVNPVKGSEVFTITYSPYRSFSA